MATPHNQAEKGEIAKKVLMPGDPLRAKFIAEHFLTDAKLVNEVRAGQRAAMVWKNIWRKRWGYRMQLDFFYSFSKTI